MYSPLSLNYIKAFTFKKKRTNCSEDLEWLVSILPFLRRPIQIEYMVHNLGDQILLSQSLKKKKKEKKSSVMLKIYTIHWKRAYSFS